MSKNSQATRTSNAQSTAQSGAEYEAVDLDDDPDIDAVSITKGKPSGKKFVATGHDNTKPSRSKVVNHKADLLKHKGYFIEVSGKIEEILKAKGVEVVDNEGTLPYTLGMFPVFKSISISSCTLPYTLGMFPKYLCSLVMHKALPYTLGMFQYLILY